MILTTWQISSFNPATQLFENEVEIIAPHASFKVPIKSTRTFEALIDGSLAAKKPEAHFTKEEITFTWRFTKKNELNGHSVRELIMGYIQAGIGVKINIHPDTDLYDADFYANSDQEIQGYFTKAEPEWVIGLDGGVQYYHFSASFQGFELG